MKRQGVWIIVLLLGVLLIVWIAYAQQNRRQNMTMPRYETSTEVTAKGVIESVDSQTGRIGWNGTHLVVKFDTATLTVHVGPSPYVEQQGFSFAQGDKIEVIGSKINFERQRYYCGERDQKGRQGVVLAQQARNPGMVKR